MVREEISTAKRVQPSFIEPMQVAPVRELVAQIEFNEWTPDGHLRHARFAGLQNDKEAGQVPRE